MEESRGISALYYTQSSKRKKKNDHNLGSPWWRLIIEARGPVGRYRLPSHNFLFSATPKSQTQCDWEKEFRATCRDEDSDQAASQEAASQEAASQG